MKKLSLLYPVKPFHCTQGFGGNADFYKVLGIKGHNGLDIVTYHGHPIYACHDGLAEYSVDGKEGHGVVITTNEPFEYKGKEVYFKSIYWHMCNPVKEPKFKSPIMGNTRQVKAGELIGYADSTGFSTGDHLHFGLKPITKKGANIEQNNGYYGAIDPMPYMTGKFYAQDKDLVISLLQKLVKLYQQLLK
jgi:murein DD-endopeptidase MepM/ murein hydrolase activator NlpD